MTTATMPDTLFHKGDRLARLLEEKNLVLGNKIVDHPQGALAFELATILNAAGIAHAYGTSQARDAKLLSATPAQQLDIIRLFVAMEEHGCRIDFPKSQTIAA